MVENKIPESVSLRENHSNPVLAPEGEILFFVWPKESIQRKGHPAAVKALVLLACQAGSAEGASLPLRRRAASLRRPVGLILWQAAMLSAAERVGKKTGLSEKRKLFFAKSLGLCEMSEGTVAKARSGVSRGRHNTYNKIRRPVGTDSKRAG